MNHLKQDSSSLVVLDYGSHCKHYLRVSEWVDDGLFGYTRVADRINLYNLGAETATDVRTIAGIVVPDMGVKDVRVEFGSPDAAGWEMPRSSVSICAK